MQWAGKVMVVGLGICLVGLGLSGCGPLKGEYTVEPTLERTEPVVFLDARLTIALRVDDIKAERTDQGRLLVKADIFNTEDHAIECRIKFKFKGKDGFLVDETNWMPIVFDRREVTNITQKSLSTKAADFVLLVRYEKEIK